MLAASSSVEIADIYKKMWIFAGAYRTYALIRRLRAPLGIKTAPS